MNRHYKRVVGAKHLNKEFSKNLQSIQKNASPFKNNCIKDFIYNGCDAVNLRDWRIRDEHLFFDNLCDIAMQILLALRYSSLYEDDNYKCICHGNLKCENVLLSYDEVENKFYVYLNDFQPLNCINDAIVASNFYHFLRLVNNYSKVKKNQRCLERAR